MRAILLLLIVAFLALGLLAYTTFQVTGMLAPLPLAGRGAILAAIVGAGGLFCLFIWLQHRGRRDKKGD